MTPHLDELISIVNHPAIQGRRGRWGIGDAVWDLFSKRYGWVTEITANSVWINFHIVSQYTEHNNPDLVWIPKLNDPIQPERGLWGMINWNRWNMYVFPDRVCMYDHKKGNNNIEIVGPTPEIAVAKAVVEQATS